MIALWTFDGLAGIGSVGVRWIVRFLRFNKQWKGQ
jgi:hypothetical protein